MFKIRSIFNLDGPVVRVLNKIADLVILNIIFLVACIPIITIVPSFVALYTVTLKLVNNKENYIFREFRTAFMNNFKQGFQLEMVLILLFGIFSMDYFLATKMVEDLTMILLAIALDVSCSPRFLVLLLLP